MKKFLSIFSLIALLVGVLVVPASASSYPPEMTKKDGTKIYSYYDGSYECIVVPSGNVQFKWNGHQVLASPKTGGSEYYKYVWNANTESWSQSGYDNDMNPSTWYAVVNIGWTVYASDLDIYDEAGELFFPLPPSLPEVVQELTEKGSLSLGTEVVGTMSNLVPFGVGCLALLTGLVLLSRKLPIFLR